MRQCTASTVEPYRTCAWIAGEEADVGTVTVRGWINAPRAMARATQETMARQSATLVAALVANFGKVYGVVKLAVSVVSATALANVRSVVENRGAGPPPSSRRRTKGRRTKGRIYFS